MSQSVIHPEQRDNGGLYCYLATPFDNRGEIDVDVLEEYTKRMIAAGVTGVTCVASTCEGPYLQEWERRLVVETVARAVAGKVQLNVGVGAYSTHQVIEHAGHAQDVGATSLMLEVPQYFSVSIQAVQRHYTEIAETIRVPIRLYNLPWATHLDLAPEVIARICDVESISSVKEASHDITRLRDLKALCGDRIALYCGFHYQALDGFRFGASGWEIMMHPLIAQPCVELYQLLLADPWSSVAEAAFLRLEPMFQFFRIYGVPQSIKAMSLRSDLSLGRMRAPLQDLPVGAEARLMEILDRLTLPTT